MLADKKTLYDELVAFCLAITQEQGFSEPKLRGKLGALTRKARQSMDPGWNDKQQIDCLLTLFYRNWGFHCDSDSYFEPGNLFLPMILEKRSGMPVSLGAVLLYLANSLNLPIYPINFPTQLILRAETTEGVFFIDPWHGEYISKARLQQLYEGAFGFGAELSSADLERADAVTLIERLQQLIKNTLIREGLNEAAFRYIERLIEQNVNHPKAADIRDRGLVLAQIGAYQAAIDDLQYYVRECPQDPSAVLIKSQLEELKSEVSSLQITH